VTESGWVAVLRVYVNRFAKNGVPCIIAVAAAVAVKPAQFGYWKTLTSVKVAGPLGSIPKFGVCNVSQFSSRWKIHNCREDCIVVPERQL
jgi:hypothetical protein